MKKRLLMLTLIGALGCTALTACGKADEPSPAKEKQEKETDEDAKEENKENKEEEPEEPDVDDPYPNDIYSEQDGAMHFMRSASEAQYTGEGMGDVYGYFFVGTWECDGYVMEIFDNGNNSYFVSIESPEINNEVKIWSL